MGEYNSYRPQVLGPEWVPIRFDPYDLERGVERGHRFTPTTSSAIRDGRFYVYQYPVSAIDRGQFPYISIYESGKETDIGSIRQITIPCDGGTLNGIPYTRGPSSVPTVAQAVSSPSDEYAVVFADSLSPTGVADAYFTFDTSSATSTLTGKRIIDVSILYAVYGNWQAAYEAGEGSFSAPSLFLWDVLNGSGQGLGAELESDNPTLDPFTGATLNSSIKRISLGEMNPVWNNTDMFVNRYRYPWIASELARFDSGAGANQLNFLVSGQDIPYDLWIGYLAMQITYCEENRVLTGGFVVNESDDLLEGIPYALGENTILLRSPSTYATGGVLTANTEYTVTVTLAEPDERGNAFSQPQLNAVRELYSMPKQLGIELLRPSATRYASIDQSRILPQLSVSATGGTGTSITAVHAYGTQYPAVVYSGNTAVQGVLQQSGGASVSYPWVRFYARNFGTPSGSLTLTRNSDGTKTVSITAAQFAELESLVDDWKQVTLEFTGAAIPTFSNTGAVDQWTWSTTDTSGDQWQVLAMNSSSYQASGTYGSTLAILNSPAASGISTADATLIFSQDPPAVSGFALSEQSMPVSGIGISCDVPNECVPSGIGYHRVTWTPLGSSSIPASGFGYYELQRYDAIDGAWSTIMQTTSVAASGFNDYEARVGIESRYRIRSRNIYEFYGDWSSELAHTLTAPGVSITGDGDGTLIFTTNEIQDGTANLAYSQSWERSPDEQFSFREANDVVLQDMYGRDFPVAFRPLERGGEQFTRTLLVQAAAVSPPVLENAFNSIRNLAWETVSYVCVRSEDGDRWYASVIVPDGVIRRFRRLQLVNVEIIEVTDTPSIVDAS